MPKAANLRAADRLGQTARLKLADSKTGPRIVWLGEEARALIDSLPRRKTNPWLFWNSRAKCPLRNVSHYWNAIRDQAGLPGVRIHDLRHTFASHAEPRTSQLHFCLKLLFYKECHLPGEPRCHRPPGPTSFPKCH